MRRLTGGEQQREVAGCGGEHSGCDDLRSVAGGESGGAHRDGKVGAGQDHEHESATAGSPAFVELLRSDDLPARLAHTLSEAWRWFIAPDWPTIRSILERDIQHRGDVLVSRGLAAALDDLDPDVEWDPRGRLARCHSKSDPFQLEGDGLWLVPNAFGGGWLCLNGQGEFALTCAARGVGTLGSTFVHEQSRAAAGQRGPLRDEGAAVAALLDPWGCSTLVTPWLVVCAFPVFVEQARALCGAGA